MKITFVFETWSIDFFLNLTRMFCIKFLLSLNHKLLNDRERYRISSIIRRKIFLYKIGNISCEYRTKGILNLLLSTWVVSTQLRKIPVGGYEVNFENDTVSFALIKFVASKTFIIAFDAAFRQRIRCYVMLCLLPGRHFHFLFGGQYRYKFLFHFLLHEHASTCLKLDRHSSKLVN